MNMLSNSMNRRSGLYYSHDVTLNDVTLLVSTTEIGVHLNVSRHKIIYL